MKDAGYKSRVHSIFTQHSIWLGNVPEEGGIVGECSQGIVFAT